MPVRRGGTRSCALPAGLTGGTHRPLRLAALGNHTIAESGQNLRVLAAFGVRLAGRGKDRNQHKGERRILHSAGNAS